MTGRDDVIFEITPQVLLKAYACGIFPMAEDAEDPGVFWIEPDMRGILPLHHFHVPRSLRKRLKKNDFEIRINSAFGRVVELCAEATSTRPSTWINRQIKTLYGDLHALGHAHSVETWIDGELSGGLYGVSLGQAFFGESMFSRAPDTSKIALVHLVARLKANGFTLLDTQFVTDHLKQFGTLEVPRDRYQELLADALQGEADFEA